MIAVIILLVLSLMLMTILFLTYLGKYNKLVKKTESVISSLKNPLRRGYFTRDLKTRTEPQELFTSTIYVTEIDRYTNGESKLEIEEIEPGIDNYKVETKKIKDYIHGSFKSVMKTSDITWLESEGKIKEIRKNKLEQLKAAIGKK